ncbi:glycosyltransferase family 4 protein [Hymenobacter sp. BT664]|uniref:Glycosyltransferase family 4 protein n=1 Tax=Hymenobacter montanus TaxID=2771359 RepID=A0A927B9M6_9BACT|nr:glycosyltransferase family 4 protein [Hymenobacter montanus]
MRVAFVSLMYDAPWGGSEVLWTHTAARALAEGHEVMASFYAWPEMAAPLQALAAAGAQILLRTRYQPSLRHRAVNWLARLPWGGELPEIRALTRFKPDVVLINQAGWMDLFFHQQLLDWLRRVPFILACHNYQDPVRQRDFSRALLTDMYSRAKEVLMISDNQLRTLQRQLVDPIANARVIQNPLNLPATYPVPRNVQTNGGLQLAVVASFDVDRKGQDVLLQALTAPEWASRRFQLNFYGQGPDQAYLEKLIQFYRLTDRVRLRGHVADTAAIWRENDLLIIPSRIESGPMVLQEAMLCGRPVVAADVGMVRDWLDDDETGFIADTASAISLNRALSRAWARRADWPAIGTLAAERVRQRIEIEPVGELLRRLVGYATDSATSGRRERRPQG